MSDAHEEAGATAAEPSAPVPEPEEAISPTPDDRKRSNSMGENLVGGEDAVAEAEAAVEEAEAVLQDDLERMASERDEFRALAQRVQADFENYRKRVLKQQTEHLERATEDLVEKLLPVLDACDAAVGHGAADVEPVYATLMQVLEKEGLERLDPAGAMFDPNEHEAVAHEEGGDDATTRVAEVFRTGYRFKGRVIRPAMVKVAG